MDELAEFRTLLRERLSERGAQARLSEESGIATQILGRWRDGIGRPTDANLKKLAPALGVPYEDLLRMCGYLPGEVTAPLPSPRRQRLARLLAAIENGWELMPDPMLDLVEPVAHALFAVQPTTANVASRRRDRVANERRELDRRRSTQPRHGPDDTLPASLRQSPTPGSAWRLASAAI